MNRSKASHRCCHVACRKSFPTWAAAACCVLISESDDSHSADLVAGSYRIERGTVSKSNLETA